MKAALLWNLNGDVAACGNSSCTSDMFGYKYKSVHLLFHLTEREENVIHNSIAGLGEGERKCCTNAKYSCALTCNCNCTSEIIMMMERKTERCYRS